MDFVSARFVLFIAAAVGLYQLSIIWDPNRRQLVLAVINIGFVAAIAGTPLELVPLAAFVTIGFGAVRLVQARPADRLLAAVMAGFILLFAYLRRYALIGMLPALPFNYTVIGMSYILFRVLQLLLDCRSGAIAQPVTFIQYVNFVCSFLTLVSGPIQRYQDHAAQIAEVGSRQLDTAATAAAFSRIINGYIKLVLLASLFHDLHTLFADGYVLSRGRDVPLFATGWYLVTMVSYTFFLYFNFSGYMDIVIGLGRLFHFDLPENFRRPFDADNFLDFWSRWHITLSSWFRTYLFNPLLKALLQRWGSSGGKATLMGIAAFFATFFVMGLWHGTSAMFIVFGLFIGCGVAMNKLYQEWMRQWLGRKGYAGLKGRAIYRWTSKGLTFSYFSIALTCVWTDLGRLHALFGPRLVPVLILAWAVVGVAAAGCMAAWQVVDRRIRPPADLATMRGSHPWRRHCWLGAKFFFLTYILLNNIYAAPEFVYQGF